LGDKCSELKQARHLQLLHVVLPREQRRPGKQLSKDAAYAPDVNCFGVLLTGQHDLWSSVPARNNILCQILLYRVREASGESQVAHLLAEQGVVRGQLFAK
jgi:hypothetical protein